MADPSGELPAGFGAVLDSLDFEEDGWITLQAFRADGAGCVLELAVRTGVDDDPEQCWRFAFADCFEYRLASENTASATHCLGLHAAPHVLLDRWTEPRAQLWFSGTVAEPSRVTEALRRAHRECSGGIPGLPRYLNREFALAELLELRVGHLAAGPAPLLRAYADVLRAHGLEPTLREYAPGHVDGRRGYEASALRALTWAGSYVVGTGLRAERIQTA